MGTRRQLTWFGLGLFVLTSCKAIVGVEESSLVTQQDGGSAGSSGTAGQGGSAGGQAGSGGKSGGGGSGGGTAGKGGSSGSGGEAGSGGSGGSDVCSGGFDPCKSGCANLQSDGKDCGVCGRACADTTNGCTNGICGPEIYTAEGKILEIVNAGGDLYWFDSNGNMFRLPEAQFLTANAATQISLPADGGFSLTTAGGSAYFLTRVAGQTAQISKVLPNMAASKMVRDNLPIVTDMLRAGNGNLYWRDNNVIQRLPQDNSEAPLPLHVGVSIRDFVVGNQVVYVIDDGYLVGCGFDECSMPVKPTMDQQNSQLNLSVFEGYVLWTNGTSLQMWSNGTAPYEVAKVNAPVFVLPEQDFIYVAENNGKTILSHATLQPKPNTIGNSSAGTQQLVRSVDDRLIYWSDGAVIMRAPAWLLAGN